VEEGMPQYLTPGVYVEVIPPKAEPISGVATTTAAFIGYSDDIQDPTTMPAKPGAPLTFSTGTVTVAAGVATLAGAPRWPALAAGGTLQYSGGNYTVATRTSDTTLTLSATPKPPDATAPVPFTLSYPDHYPQVAANKFVLVTDWLGFIHQFGDFQPPPSSGLSPTTYPQSNYLAHAIYGFFTNSGSRCYVARVNNLSNFQTTLDSLATNNKVAMVCAPMPPAIGGTLLTLTQMQAIYAALIIHCEQLQNRVAILDCMISSDSTVTAPSSQNGFEAFYFPWVKVAVPGGNLGDLIDVPPAGHIAGVYARTDTQRGVYKAPANEQLLGVSDITYPLSDSIQAGLNPINVNCLRVFSNTTLIWGARTVATDPQFRYVNVRRFLIFLRESILDGVRWAVFEPNSTGLWQRITRSVSDFLLTQWQEGALVGDTPQDAFFVRCDKTTNTPDVQAQGMVVTEIGVAIVKPAEFVIFRIQQQTGR
jgi:phage tail sheath protein FI